MGKRVRTVRAYTPPDSECGIVLIPRRSDHTDYHCRLFHAARRTTAAKSRPTVVKTVPVQAGCGEESWKKKNRRDASGAQVQPVQTVGRRRV